jgi:hypothetical protein
VGKGSAAAGSTATSAKLAGASIVYTADLTVRATNVTAAADHAAQIAEQAGGYVSNESTASGTGTGATVDVKIQVTDYPQTLATLARDLGTRLSEHQQATDVTQQVADVNSQVTSDQAAIAQLRTLLSHAGSIGDLLNVQNQINSEETNLEAIESQQRALSQQVNYATVTVTIVAPPAAPAVVHHSKPKPPPGPGNGLSAGWHALGVTVRWALVVLGAIAPFAAVAAIAGYVGYRVRRRMRRTLHE